MRRTSGDISSQLPVDAYLRGWTLTWMEQYVDPVYLRDKQRQMLYEWDYIPSLVEVSEVCSELERR